MKKLLYIFAAIASISTAITIAEEKALTVQRDFSNVKIAFMDPYSVLEKSKEWEDLTAKIKADIEKRTQKITKMAADFQKKDAELKNMGNVASANAKEKKQKELLSLKNDIEIEKSAAQEIPQQQAQMAQMEMLKKIEAAANKIAKELGIDIVLAGSTIYVADRVNITQLVVDELNKNYKPVAKPGTTPAPAKK